MIFLRTTPSSPLSHSFTAQVPPLLTLSTVSLVFFLAFFLPYLVLSLIFPLRRTPPRSPSHIAQCRLSSPLHFPGLVFPFACGGLCNVSVLRFLLSCSELLILTLREMEFVMTLLYIYSGTGPHVTLNLSGSIILKVTNSGRERERD